MSNSERDDSGSGPDSPKVNDKPSASESAVLGIKPTKGHDIAKKAVEAKRDYKKHKLDQLKLAIVERDDELLLLAKEFLGQESKLIDQEARINKLRRALNSKKKEVTSLITSTNEANARALKLTDALIGKVNKPSTSGEGAEKGDDSNESNADTSGGTQKAPSAGPSAGSTPRSIFDYPEYQTKIKTLNLDQLCMKDEANTLITSEALNLNDETEIRYEVPMHLMGHVMGRQKATINRIVAQTSTEIEPISWVTDGRERLMGFKILGATADIKRAIDEIIKTIREMEDFRAVQILKGHIKPEQGTRGGKSAKICSFFRKGFCRNGAKCGLSHRKTSK